MKPSSSTAAPSSGLHVQAPSTPSGPTPSAEMLANRFGGGDGAPFAPSPHYSHGSEYPFLSQPEPLPPHQQPLRSPSDKGSRPLLARGRSFFGAATGASDSTTQMFTSSPRGARAAARRARLLQQSESRSSVWTASQPADGAKRGDSLAARVAGAQRSGSAGPDGSAAAAAAGSGHDRAAVQVVPTEAGVKGEEEAAAAAAAAAVASAAGSPAGIGGVLRRAEAAAAAASSSRGADEASSSNGRVPERTIGVDSPVNGERSPTPLSRVPPAPAPPLLSGSGRSGRSAGEVAATIDTVSSASSDAVNGGGGGSSSSSGGDTRDSSSAEFSVRSSPEAGGAAKHLDPAAGGSKGAGGDGGGSGVAPNLALARASLRRVARGDGGGGGVVGKKGGEDGVLKVSLDGLRSRSDSGDGSPASKSRRAESKALQLEERRAALVAASQRTSAGPPPPPPRLLSQSQSDPIDGVGDDVARLPSKKLPLARSKTTVADTSLSSARTAAASAFLTNTNRQSESFDDAPSVVVPLRPAMRPRQPRKEEQETPAAAAAAAAATSGNNEVVISVPAPSSLSPSSVSSMTPPVRHRPLATTSSEGGKLLPAVVTPSPARTPAEATGAAAVNGNGRPAGAVSEALLGEQSASARQGGKFQLTAAAAAALALGSGDGISPPRSNGSASAGARSLVPGPRLVPAMNFDAEPRAAARAGTAPGAGAAAARGKRRVVVPMGRSADDLPPAEMGALGVSLICAMCGAEETKKVSGPEPGLGGGIGGEGGDAATAAAAGAAAEVEVTRCSRCRKGCCNACYKNLPVHCRGSKVVVPGEFLFVLVV